MGICLIVKSGGGTDTSNANVTADKILSGYTVYSNDNKITGTMNNVGNQCKVDSNMNATNGVATMYPGWTFGLWGGWHDGTAVLNTVSLASQTSGLNMDGAGDVLWGYTYWSGGERFSGMMPAVGKKEWTIDLNGEQKIEVGWHDGAGTVKQSSTIYVDSGEWGLGGSTSNQQLCWAGCYYSKNRWCWGASTLTADNIKKGVVIYGIIGTWATTARMLIENGALTGLLSSGYYGDTSSYATTASWNGSNYVLLYAVGWWWGGSDEGYSKTFERMLYFSNAANFGTISSKHIGFVVRGDFHDAYANQTPSGNRTPITEVWACCEAKKLDAYKLPTTTGSGGTLAWTTSGSMTWDHYNYLNALTTTNRIYFNGRGGGTIKWSYEYTIWAKNLWLETSVTI